MKTKKLSTHERMMQNPEFREKFKKAQEELDLSEAMHEIMASATISVRKLSKLSGVAASIIQDIRKGNTNPTFATFTTITHSLGYNLELRKGRKIIPVACFPKKNATGKFPALSTKLKKKAV